MVTPHNPRESEQPSTYFVENRQNKDELFRLTIQDQMLTKSMGGVLPELADPSLYHRILDIGCGPGSWGINVVQSYPEAHVVGIDISQRMINYAQEQAAAKQVSERSEFLVMDALQGLQFSNAAFDLVNLRLGVSFMRVWEWPRLIAEMLRVLRPGGVLRLIDQEILHTNESPAYRRCNRMFVCAFYRSGHLFTDESTGLTDHLAPLLRNQGCLDVQTRLHALEYQAGTPLGQDYYNNMVQVFQTSRPFLRKWGCAGGDYDQLARQALEEIQAPGFQTTWRLWAIWGYKANA